VSKLATIWFADNERALATTIGSLSTPIGCIIGMVIGPIFVSEIDKWKPEQGKISIQYYLFISAIICTGLSIWMIFFFKEKPKFYPSKAAMSSNSGESFSISKDLKLLATNKNYLFMILSFNMLYGVYTSLGACINNLVEPFGYTSANSALFGATFIFSGLIGSFIASGILDRKK